MRIVDITPGSPEGAPAHVTFRVWAVGSTDAADKAKREARESGWRTKTLGRVDLVGPADGTERTALREWDVMLVARPPALPEGVLFAGTVGEFLDLVEGGS